MVQCPEELQIHREHIKGALAGDPDLQRLLNNSRALTFGPPMTFAMLPNKELGEEFQQDLHRTCRTIVLNNDLVPRWPGQMDFACQLSVAFQVLFSLAKDLIPWRNYSH